MTSERDVYEYSIVREGEKDWRPLPNWMDSPYRRGVAAALALLLDQEPGEEAPDR